MTRRDINLREVAKRKNKREVLDRIKKYNQDTKETEKMKMFLGKQIMTALDLNP